MGLHYVFRYVGYESSFLKTYIELLDRFCTGCHTNEDVNGDCSKCPIGNLINRSEDYLTDSHESDILEEEKKIIKKIKKELNKIPPPHPFFNGAFITSEKRNKDVLLKLRELLKDLEFERNSRHRYFNLTEEHREVVGVRIEKELEKEKKLIKNGRRNKK